MRSCSITASTSSAPSDIADIAAVKVAEALGVDPAEVKPGAKVTKIIAIKYAEDGAEANASVGHGQLRARSVQHVEQASGC